MNLFQYYSIDECLDTKLVIKKLNELKKEGRIDYKIEDQDLIKVKDIDLDEDEIEDLIKLFDSNDVFPYLEKDEDDEDDSYLYDDMDDDSYDY
jgi:hypothetical protein